MQKYRQAAASIAFLTFLLTAGLYSDLPDSRRGLVNRRQTQKQEAILTAFENNDYHSWQRHVGQNSQIAQVISPKDFNKFVTARQAARSGQYDQAIAISTELGYELTHRLNGISLS
ncbi:MAG: hypothetical protein WCK11_04760 [Candidatus Falkowbacteria bacterium]